jgi:large subunit ribosomal protein L4
MNVKCYNQIGKEVGQARLPKEVFGLQVKADLVHQVVVSQMANRRQATAHTKDRSEKRGGGRKPWRQKGTGRARHGSIRSPLWRGGGVTFGPRKEKVYKKQIPQKMKRKALLMALSGKAKNGLLLLLDEIKFAKISTKQVAEMLKKLPCSRGSILIALPRIDKNIILSARNIPKVETIQAKDLNALDVLSYKWLVIPKESIKLVKEIFTK